MNPWLIALLLVGADPAVPETPNWPALRGPDMSRSAIQNLPLEWSAEKNIAWRADLQGYGQSTPVVWGEQAFATSAVGEQKQTLLVTSLAVKTGKTLWKRELPTSGKEAVTDYISRSAPSPVVDAQRVYVFFESGDLAALTHAGEVVWKRSLADEYGKFQGNHGIGSSLALAGESVIVLIDHDGPSYLLAVDPATGKNRWKVDRDKRVSWSSPIVVAGPERTEILISSNGVAQAIDAKDGSLLWQVDDLDGNTVASPSATDELVVIGSSRTGSNLAIRRGGKGKVTDSHIAWRAEDATCSFGSPLIHGEHVYFVSRAGVAESVELATGKSVATMRVGGSCWASPLGAGERVYFFTREGTTLVTSADGKLTRLAENLLPTEDRVYGVAAIPGALLIRTGSQITCVGTP